MKLLDLLVVLSMASACAPAFSAERHDILVADFEEADYGEWKVVGTAFGRRPAQGTLAGQMPVSGFLGKGLVNSFFEGDDAKGKLTSPAFVIERKHINFLIGGGKHPAEACINLMIDGKVLRTATGPNGQAGGSEQLDWTNWDVGELAGKTAVIEIIDERQGGWGHICIDQIIQSDHPRSFASAKRELIVDKKYLHLPVKTGGRKLRMKFVDAGQTLREFEIELAEGTPDLWAFADVSQFLGRRLLIEVEHLAEESNALDAIRQAGEIPDADRLYSEQSRPQFHFTSRFGWLNDPNGLVYSAGEWHLFYQHNPYGWNWGNMHWGHATSKDLVHWQELPIALYPQKFDDWCFSGSAVVDTKNTSGFKTGGKNVLVAAYTSTARGECIVYSNDAGQTWTEFSGNPVVKHAGRDPKLFWHEPSHAWVMAVYDEFENTRQIAFYTTPDLKTWQFQSRINGFYECPDLFELPLEGKPGQSRWVLYGADGKYVLGQFDGRKFTPETEKLQLWHGNFYAAQTYSDAPEGRRVQIGWGQGIEFPGMPFNQQMAIPVELTLQQSVDGPRLFAEPVRELSVLNANERSWSNVELVSKENPLADFQGELFRITAEIELGQASSVGFVLRGVPVRYDVATRQLSCKSVAASLEPADGCVSLEILVDRGSIEVFGNRGRIALSVGVAVAADDRSLRTEVTGSGAKLRSLKVVTLKSAWK